MSRFLFEAVLCKLMNKYIMFLVLSMHSDLFLFRFLTLIQILWPSLGFCPFFFLSLSRAQSHCAPPATIQISTTTSGGGHNFHFPPTPPLSPARLRRSAVSRTSWAFLLLNWPDSAFLLFSLFFHVGLLVRDGWDSHFVCWGQSGRWPTVDALLRQIWWWTNALLFVALSRKL